MRAVPPRAAAPPAPTAAPSPARLRPAFSEAFEPETPAAAVATPNASGARTSPPQAAPGAPSAPQAPNAAPGLPTTPPSPTAAPQAAAGLDRDSLEEAMTEVLRDAARQHGLEV